LVGVTELDTTTGRWVERLAVPALEVFVDLNTGMLQDIWFGAGAHLAAVDGGIWTADGRGGDLVVYGLAMSSACKVLIGGAGPTVTAAERDSFYMARDLEYRGPDRVARARDRRRNVVLPDRQPVIADVVGARDLLWVHLPREDGARWIALDSKLRVHAQLALPSAFAIVAVHRNLLYVHSQTPEGTPVLMEYALEFADAGGGT
jgi:hypothetical protein